jgi:long-chain acyl-CoA synthetase
MDSLKQACGGLNVYPVSLSADPIQPTVRGERPVPERPSYSAPAACDVAVLQYTSGTTASAKGAMMTHRNLVANALQNARWFGWSGEEVTLAVLPLCHTWGMCCCLNSTIAVGGTLVLADQRKGFDPDATCAEVERARATVLYGSATMFHRLMEGDAKTLARRQKQLLSLRHVKAGAMLSQGSLKPRWDAFCVNAPLRQGYGLTEASPESHNNPPERFKAGTVGVPIQDTEARIVDAEDASRELPAGQAGEVLLRGPQITLGYWRRPEATKAAFHEGWLKTGDIGVMDAEGYLSIVDRKKDLLKFRGFSISPNTIEEALLRHPSVREAVVVGRLDERDGEVPTAFVVLKSAADEPSAEATLKAHCEGSLAQYERPRAYYFVNEIPKNHVAKPLRRVLRDQLNAQGS